MFGGRSSEEDPTARPAGPSEAFVRLAEVVGRLHPVQVDLLLLMARAMEQPVQEEVHPGTDVVVPAFNISFRNRLVLHHATNPEKFSKKSFEYAFCGASEAAGRRAEIIRSATIRGVDVIVDKVPISLKTEASQGIRPQSVTISKLSEVRWIQQCSTLKELADKAATLIPASLGYCRRIFSLRAFSVGADAVKYDLVEIPRDLLLLISGLTVKDFSERTTQGGSSASVYLPEDRTQPAFRLRLDGSDGKVTITGLRTGLCVVHGSWTIPVLCA